jgi:hypothetical protein
MPDENDKSLFPPTEVHEIVEVEPKPPVQEIEEEYEEVE